MINFHDITQNGSMVHVHGKNVNFPNARWSEPMAILSPVCPLLRAQIVCFEWKMDGTIAEDVIYLQNCQFMIACNLF